MSTRHQRPAEAFPYDSFIREEMIERGWSLGRLAIELGVSRFEAEELAMGRTTMDLWWAWRLAVALDTTAEYWVNLDAAYQDWRGAT